MMRMSTNKINVYLLRLPKLHGVFGLGLGLWCLTSLSTIFQLYRGDQFY
jgi:hypothetical protein